MISKARLKRDYLLLSLGKEGYTTKPKQSAGEYYLIKKEEKIGTLCIAGNSITIIFK